jgi:hypothetical protein
MTTTLYRVELEHGVDITGRGVGYVFSPRGGGWYFATLYPPPRTTAECRAVCDTLDPDAIDPPRGRDSIAIARRSLMSVLRAEMRRVKLKESAQ